MQDYIPLLGHYGSSLKGQRRLFKGGGGGGGSSTQTVQNFSPAESANRAQLQDEAERIYNQTKEIISGANYPGPKVVDFSPESLAAQIYGVNFANKTAPELNNQLAAAQKFGLSDVLNPETNPALQAAVASAIRPITESYTDPNGVFSQIRTGAITNGGQGRSTRQGIAEGLAAGRYAGAVGDVASKMVNENYQKGLDTFSRTMALAPQNMESMLTPMKLLSAVGTSREGVAQEIENAKSNAAMWKMNAPWMGLQNYANIIYGGSSPGTTTTTTGGNTGASTGQRLLGGAMSGWALGSSVGTAMGLGSWAGPAGAVAGALLGGLF